MIWSDGYEAYLQSYEVRLHRRKDTYGGRTWPQHPIGLISEGRRLEIAIQALENVHAKA